MESSKIMPCSPARKSVDGFSIEATPATRLRLRLALLAGIFATASIFAQDTPPPAQDAPPPDSATVAAEIGGAGGGKIVVEAHGIPPKAPVFFTASANAVATIGGKRINQVVSVNIKVLQGEAETLTLGVNGPGEVVNVDGQGILAWSVRRVGPSRFLDIKVPKETKEQALTVTLRSAEYEPPVLGIDLTHLAAGEAVGFRSIVSLQYLASVDGIVAIANGFTPLKAKNQFETSTGGQLNLHVNRSGAQPGPVELQDARLVGTVDEKGDFAHFKLTGKVVVTKPGELKILRGAAAASGIAPNPNIRLNLATEDNGAAVYQLVLDKAGEFPVDLDFVATLGTENEWRSFNFAIPAASAVVPLTLNGIAAAAEFRDTTSVVPILQGAAWRGFLPADGNCVAAWKQLREAGEGKLFFITAAKIEAAIGAGLLRQSHQIDFQVLQGDLDAIALDLAGPGEVLAVEGGNILGWEVVGADDARKLEVKLSQPMTRAGTLTIRSQTALDAFPVRVTPLRLTPVGAVRHSGYIRLINQGSVRLEPAGLLGLTQLAPEQFPADAIEARQIFVYRFPAAEHAYEVAADRIQPEINVSQIVVYELAETDRVIRADIELDIREAPLRDWDFLVPSDYSVVSVTGAAVGDYVVATQGQDGVVNLKVIFNQEIAGRQLISLHLEKNEPAAAGTWVLPKLTFPSAETVRGDIGIASAPGYRIGVGATDLLVEKALSYFPSSSHYPSGIPTLQQAFRIREREWTAAMTVELLDESIQADVFHLYSLNDRTAFASVVINYFVTGAPVGEWRINLPAEAENVNVEGKDVRGYSKGDDNVLTVNLHGPVIGPYMLLVTYEEEVASEGGLIQPGRVEPLGVQGERGFIEVVSPVQVQATVRPPSESLLKLDPLELPAEFRLLSTAPPLATYQYTARPFELAIDVAWFAPGETTTQVIEFADATSRVSSDGDLVTDITYDVKTRGQSALKLRLPDGTRLWEVKVGGQSATARQDGDDTLIPLPGVDPNSRVEVQLRIGKASVKVKNPVVGLPKVFGPVLKTQWRLLPGEKDRVLIPVGGTVDLPDPGLMTTGINWIASRGIAGVVILLVLAVLGVALGGKRGVIGGIGLAALLTGSVVAFYSAGLAHDERGVTGSELHLSLPVLTSEDDILLQVKSQTVFAANWSYSGLFFAVLGLGLIVWSLMKSDWQFGARTAGALSLAAGILLQPGGAAWFLFLVGIILLFFLFFPRAWRWFGGLGQSIRAARAARRAAKAAAAASGAATAVIAALLMIGGAPDAQAEPPVYPEGFHAADSIKQTWDLKHEEGRLTGSGTASFSGKPGDQFILLRAPAVLTDFQGEGLRVTKQTIPNLGLTYVVSVAAGPVPAPDPAADPFAAIPAPSAPLAKSFDAKFEFQLEVKNPLGGFAIPTGAAAVQELEISLDKAGWDFASTAAVRVEPLPAAAEQSKARLLLAPQLGAAISLKPKMRDVADEATQFYVEASNLYLPGPGVVDGRHQIQIRPSQGQVSALKIQVPAGLTVSEVQGPVGSWQFDADNGQLSLEIEPPQPQAFALAISTQRGLDPLPADLEVAPLTVPAAAGEVGLVALAFGPDAQPESAASETLSAVNLSDFDAAMLQNAQATLHQVFRYGQGGGTIALRVAPVAPEVRVTSQQIVSLGDERLVMNVNFIAEITRAGLFQLSFPLPAGLEVDSISGDALHHWAELTEDDERRITLHLNGKTIGQQPFTVTLSGPAPEVAAGWEVPRFALAEASRQTGQLVVRPDKGIRLNTSDRQNVSEIDPREMGGQGEGALAFRLLQQDWSLTLGIEKLDPWVTGQVLHEITLREGQTRTVISGNFNVQNASIRSLQVQLPITDEEVIKTVRASGSAVSDIIRTAPDSDLWEIQFSRRVVNDLQIRIEYERRGERENGQEKLELAAFPEARQLTYHFAIRSGGRLELDPDVLTKGWQRADWNNVAQALREAGDRSAPARAFRAVAPEEPLVLTVRRHDLAESLKLRVANGTLTTILSPLGDQLTGVDLTMEVIQRSSLTVKLPAGGKLFSIFVNGESVNSVVDSGSYQFYILPGADDRSAQVKFVYSVPGDQIRKLDLVSPLLNVPLENIHWHVIAPADYRLRSDDGNMELVNEFPQYLPGYDRQAYLAKVQNLREQNKQQAEQLLEQALTYLDQGQQSKANWALNSVANQYALDAASNEDARVQLENLQTQQAVVGLNTRRQRLYLDNNDQAAAPNEQLEQGAANNPILKEGAVNFRPQDLGQLLQGNTSEDNAVLQRIAGKLVRHQKATDPAPQAISIVRPEEGAVYTFRRTVQVNENQPLALNLRFGIVEAASFGSKLVVILIVAGLVGAIVFVTLRTRRDA